MPIATSMIIAGAAVAGVGMQAYGMNQSSKASKQMAQAQAAQAAEEQKMNELRRQQMELENTRRAREQIRSGQKARSLALTTATAQGAAGPGSSALGGAYGQISGGMNTNLGSLSQAYDMGMQSFDINNTISGLRGQMAGYSSDLATAQGWSALGGSVASLGSAFGRIGGGVGASANPSSNYLGNSSMGNPMQIGAQY